MNGNKFACVHLIYFRLTMGSKDGSSESVESCWFIKGKYHG